MPLLFGPGPEIAEQLAIERGSSVVALFLVTHLLSWHRVQAAWLWSTIVRHCLSRGCCRCRTDCDGLGFEDKCFGDHCFWGRDRNDYGCEDCHYLCDP